jgi:catechol 2,3-dioxygenase-like lactoylglutathione lyase family enzyme
VPLALARPTLDLGIVTTNRAASRAFYGGTLGLPELEELRMDGFSISRFQIGDCILKILEFDQSPRVKAAAGGLGAATGIRYWTMSVSNLDEVLDACRAAGRPIADGPTEVAPGVTIVLVEDPDGNLVEFVSRSAA